MRSSGPNWLKKFEQHSPFSADEAWLLFRVAAFAEAIGWTLLIIGILCKRYVFHGNDIPVLLTGRIHGTIFLLYLAASIALYPALRWSRLRAVVAVIASVPPYGSLLFEQWESHRRTTVQFKAYQQLVAYVVLVKQTSA